MATLLRVRNRRTKKVVWKAPGMLSEAALSTLIEKKLQAFRVPYLRNNSGVKGHTDFGLRCRGVTPEIKSGGPDYLARGPIGMDNKLIGIEAKTEGKLPTPDQRRWYKHMERVLRVFVVRRPRDVDRLYGPIVGGTWEKQTGPYWLWIDA